MDTREAFALELGRVSRRWRTRLNERFRHGGLTNARWNTLLQLSRSDSPLTQTELAIRLGVEGPTLVRLLDALEKQGLIRRQPAAHDRRVKHISLTAAARPVLARINRVATEVRNEILAEVRADELKTCLAVLRRIGDRLERTADESR